MADEATVKAYRDAWQGWMKHLEGVHAVLLDGEPMTPDRLKGLLNREARAKQAYDDARLKLLGLDEGPRPLPASDENPFR